MKIMVVGSSGYIGRNVVQSLSNQGAEVVAFDLAPVPAQWNTPGVSYVQGNMVNLEEVMSVVLDHGVQRIVALDRKAKHLSTFHKSDSIGMLFISARISFVKLLDAFSTMD